MAAEIEKLIERLENATGPDRELDCYIFAAINPQWSDEDVKNILLKPYLVCKYGEDKCCTPQHQIEDGLNADHLANVPHYTSSIDAALTLVPEGCVWALNFASMASIMRPGKSGVLDGEIIGQWPRDNSEADKPVSPAIALCIANLRAIGALK